MTKIEAQLKIAVETLVIITDEYDQWDPMPLRMINLAKAALAEIKRIEYLSAPETPSL